MIIARLAALKAVAKSLAKNWALELPADAV